MIVVDTTVLVYAVGADHPLRDSCRTLVEWAGAGGVRVTTTVEVIQEFTHVRARRRPRQDATRLARHWMELTGPLLQPTAEDLDAGLALFEDVDEIGCFDAVLAATALRSGASALVSADQAFGRVPGLSWLDPADPAFLDRLRPS